MVKLVEHCAGTGDLLHRDQVVRQVRYNFSVFQGMVGESGLPIPGRRTLTGSIDFDPARDSNELIGPVLTLKLEDGRHLGITLVGDDGAIAEGRHGHGACMCC
jgi:hypothetical protein